MWRYMESKKPSVFVSTHEEGVRRVLDGNYAFLMESTTLDYFVQRNCNLTQVEADDRLYENEDNSYKVPTRI